MQHLLQATKKSISKKINLIPLLAASLLYIGCSDASKNASAPPPPSLPVMQVASASELTYQEYPASIEGILNVDIRPQVSGSLDKVFVDEGSFVKQGTPLFKINELPYRAQYNNALASLHAAEANLLTSQLEIDKITPLVANKVVSEYQLKTAKAANQAAKANIEQAKANVATAEINLGYTLIKAPGNGYIGRLQKKKGSLVGPQDVEALTQLSDVHEMRVYFSLGEKDFVDFKKQYPGETLKDKMSRMPAVSLLLADDSEYVQKGRIDMIDGQFNKTTGAITLRASFPNPDGLLRSGNTGRVRLGVQHNDALIVPQSSTVEAQDKVFVFTVADSNKVKKVPIHIVGKSGTNYLVSDGIKAGDRIVLSGIDHLQEGSVIKPENAPAHLAQAK